MRRKIKVFLFSVVLLLPILCFFACKGGDGDGDSTSAETAYYTVVYQQEMAENKTLSIEVGSTPSSADIPEIVYKKGYTAAWEEKSFSSAQKDAVIVVSAVYTPKTYTVSYDVDGGTPLEATTVYFGQEYTLEIAEKENCILNGYVYFDGETNVKVSVQGVWAMDENVTVKAVYAPISYEVLFDTAGGNFIPSAAFVYDQTIVSLPTPEKAGYAFIGWKLLEGGQATGEYILPGQKWQFAEGVTLIACYEELPASANYTYTFRVDGEEDVNVVVAEGGIIPSASIPEIQQTVTGYVGSWSYENELVDFSAPATKNMVFTIKYAPKQYCIKFDTQGGESIPNMYVKYDEIVTLPTPTKEGFVFNDSWYFGEDNMSVNVGKWQIDQEEDILLTVQWYVTVTFKQTGFADKVYKVKVGESFTETMPKCETTASGLYTWDLTGVSFQNLQSALVVNAYKLNFDPDWTENL